MLSRLGPWEIILILVVVIFVFGVGKLPEVGKSVGKAIFELKKSLQNESFDKEKTTGNQTRRSKKPMKSSAGKIVK